MRVLFLDNNIGRHSEHNSFINKYPDIDFNLKEEINLQELQFGQYDFYVIHRGNDLEYRFIYVKQLGLKRIFFSGGERNPRKIKQGIFTDTQELYNEIENVISANS